MIKQFCYRVLCGFLLGLSVFAPGFSGSVIAIIMGIYRDLVRIASNPFKRLKENIMFCLPLGLGAVISAVLFIIFFQFLFETYEKATYLLFIGLIIGNLPVVFREVKKCGFHKRYLVGAVFAFAAAFLLGLMTKDTGAAADTETLRFALPMMALSGLAAGAVAPIPGMSISMVLIMLRVYRQLIFAAKSLLQMEFTYLLPFGLFCICMVCGAMLASRGIKFIFERYPGFANSMVFGFMSGSLMGILIQSLRMEDAHFSWLMGSLMLAAGLGISLLFILLGKAISKEKPE